MERLIWVYRILCCFFLLHFSQVSCSSSLVFLSSSNNYTSPKVVMCRHDQSLALIQFKQTFTISGYVRAACGDVSVQVYNPKTMSWNQTTDCCSSWDGVTCDASTGHVIGLDLSHSGLQGTLHSNSSLFQLHHLQRLNLACNNFNSSQMPSEFGWSFKSLDTLDLSGCSFSGSIPQSLGNLTQITHLDLSGNYLNGTIPPWLFTHLPSLQYLDLNSNHLAGPIPKSIFKLVNLTWLDLSSNNLSGIVELHMFSKLQNLQLLDLSYNSLSCSTDNNANFTFPKIRILILSPCEMSELPGFLRNLEVVKYVDLSNSKIHGQIPKWLGNMGKDSLNSLNLSHNFLTGSVPQLPWITLGTLDLRFNLLQGPLPVPPYSTNYFRISNNNLSGEVPSLICNASSLGILDLSYNNLGGVIPQCLGNFSTDLEVLDLRMNRFHGTIPATFAESISSLNLNGNQLEGPVPPSLANCTYLEVLDLGNNNINDTFPHWLETLPHLQILVLQSNKFHGPIATNSKTEFPFPKLRIIDLSHNEFNGLLPRRYLQNLSAMMNVDKEKMELKYMGGDYYQDSVTLMIKGQKTILVRILTIFTTIDLSNNKFQGEIPSLVGKLNSLRLLNLSHNNLRGDIPSGLASLTMLESLDLSSNQLLGQIPQQLTDLTFLAVLNLSQNHLEGPIPRGRQFATFQSDSYNGNLALCGFPLPNKCGNDEAVPPSPIFQEADNDSNFTSGFSWGVTLMGYGCGLVFGLSMGYIMFATGKPEWFVRIIEGKCCQIVKRSKKGRAGRGNIRFIGK